MMRRIILMAAACGLMGLLCTTPGLAREYKLGHIFPATHTVNVALEKFASEIKDRSGGKITFAIMHSGILGGDNELATQVMSGTLHAVASGGMTIYGNFKPALFVEELPFLFTDAAMAHRAQDGEFGAKVNKEYFDELRLVCLGYMENGFRNFTNSRRPIVKPDDMKGLKFRSAPVPLRMKMFSALGANAVVIAFPELFTALQQGTVDAQENPLGMIYTAKFHEVQKYLSISGHTYNSAPILFNKQFWNSLKEDDRKLINEVMQENIAYQRQINLQTEQDLLKTLADSGMEVNNIDKDAFVQAVQSAWDDFIKENGRDLLDLILKVK